ncbi:ATP-binding cassette domain-containing protein [Enterococcus hirae]|uniref:ABC transporter ATP-binding protein n=2 Tax=Enterococcus hirae TaxID=1354 RepID=UPI000B9FD7EB|nr:ABC transporter ATP-binding protein [Enterococcus hirae]ASV82148.1 ABC transporter ATP-binding protein [Enterococcus hirae]MDD9144773.1 ABC transporter ATP-binding protein/permease [Enterococcus hirae]MEB5734075.1 ABC transporter ATP-binding protein/permease [Enterococcus hirae]MEC4730336.1 ABC transporter ATP-binding protein/permease [Enterococcus hirae]NAA12646.1 ATP-binding cassette domain-containing protein [Enterococcus hirae]
MKTTDVKMNKHSLIRFWKMIQSDHKTFYGLLLCSLIGNLMVVAMPMIMGVGIDQLLSRIHTIGIAEMTFHDVKDALLFPVVLLLVFSFLSSITSFIQEYAMASLSEKITLNVRKEMTKKFKTLPMAFFDQHQVGDIISRTTTGLNQLAQVLLTGINQFFTSIVTILFSILMLFYIDSKLTLLILLLIVGSSWVTQLFANKNKKISDDNQTELGSLNNKVEEYLAGNLVIKTFNQQDQAIESIRQVNHSQYQAFKKAQFMNFAIYPAIRLINQSAFILSAVLGGILVISGGLTLGLLQAYLQYINQISEPISTASYVINSLQSAMAAIDRIFEIMDEPNERSDHENTASLDQPAGSIRFKDVRFGYSPDKILMENVNFSAKPKQTIAIVGPTGAGKTTLVNLLMRFYELNHGRIEFDGIDITKFSRSELRKHFGMVLQNTWLFEGTVADNIAYGKQQASRDEIIAAAKIAQCDHFIRTLPEGYDTIISSENGSLSQGQQQLLTIARVLLANPSVVILDEATSSVDTRTEAMIQKAMNAVTENRTSFIIAHRLSTIENADLILVMENGNIIEQGTHQSLLSKPTLYASLYNSQFQIT